MQPAERILISMERKEGTVSNLLLGMTPAIAQIDLAEIMDWTYALQIADIKHFDPLNLVFFPLPSGSFAFGRLIFDFMTFQQAQREIFFFQVLVISSDTLRAFDNNPIRIYEKALASRQLMTNSFLNENREDLLAEISAREKPWDFSSQKPGSEKSKPIELAPFELDCSPIDSDVQTELLKGISVEPGIRAVAVLIQSILDSIVTSFDQKQSAINLLQGVFELLPIHWRTELSFGLGLNFSGEHYLRLVSSNAQNASKRASSDSDDSQFSSALPRIDLTAIKEGRINYEVIEGWPLFIELVLQKDAFEFLRQKMRADFREREEESMGEPEVFCDTETIHFLGFEWLYQLKHLISQNPDFFKDFDLSISRADQAHPLLETELPYPENPRQGIEFEQPLVILEGKNIFSPFQRLSARFSDRNNDLTRLDSLIAHYLNGSFFSKDILEKFWMDLQKKYDDDFLWAVREEYIHYIRSFLINRDSDQIDEAMRENVAALDIINMFIG